MPSDRAPLTDESAADFFRCGFALADLDLWLDLPDVVREVLVGAADTVARERAYAAAYAGLSEYHAAEVAGPLDGGQRSRRLCLRDAAAAALETVRGTG